MVYNSVGKSKELVMKKIVEFIQSNTLFTVAFILALVSVLIGRFDWQFINYGIITTLFGMMLMLALYEGSGLLRYGSIKIIERSNSTRSLVRNMVLFSFIGSFLLTNDVAVLTLFPIYLRIINSLPKFKGAMLGAVMIPIAANLGGVFFPFSNPQNLIIYDYYSISLGQFVSWTAPLLLVSLVLVLLTSIFVEAKDSSSNLEQKEMDKPLLIKATIGMLLMILTVFGILPVYEVVLVISIWVFFAYRKYFKHVDYALLGIFLSFFIIVGNISEWPAMNNFMTNYVSSKQTTYLSSIFLSQFISNVPATILISPFTEHTRALLLSGTIKFI